MNRHDAEIMAATELARSRTELTNCLDLVRSRRRLNVARDLIPVAFASGVVVGAAIVWALV